MSEPIPTPYGKVVPSSSIGAAIISEKKAEARDALKRTDIARYQSKNSGRGRSKLLEGISNAAP